ncbi:hypothetical protein D9M71_675240 [compost metagenome]
MPWLLDAGVPLGAQPFVTHGAAAIEYAERAIGLEVVMGLGLGTFALVAHWQARQLEPFALVTLEVDIAGGLRCQRVVRGGGTATQQHHQA